MQIFLLLDILHKKIITHLSIKEDSVTCIIGVLLYLLVMMSFHFKICVIGQTIMEK